MLYQWEISQISVDDVLDTYWRIRPAAPACRAFATSLVCGVTAQLKTVDGLLTESVRGWRLERLTVIDRSILRLAVFELAHERDTPAAVVIDEALELAKRFSVAEAVAFINGVLDNVRKKLAETA